MLHRKEYTAGISVVIADRLVNTCFHAQETTKRMCRDAFTRFAESNRKGNYSMVDWIGQLETHSQREPALSATRIDMIVRYVKVPRKHYTGHIPDQITADSLHGGQSGLG